MPDDKGQNPLQLHSELQIIFYFENLKKEMNYTTKPQNAREVWPHS